jgi:thiosulfate dehydrogenase
MGRFLLGIVIGVVLAPLAVVGAARAGLLSLTATASPPAWEARLGRTALHASAARGAKSVFRSASATVTEEDLGAGLRLYRMNCSGCHGDFGRPSSWGTTSFFPRVPQFAEHPSTLTRREMFFVVQNGVRYSGMGAWKNLLSDSDIWRVVSFVGRIRSLPPSVEERWKHPPQ